MFKHFPSDRVAMAAKAKQEPCVWVKDEVYKGGYLPGCANGWKLYLVPTICGCGKNVEVKK